MRILITGATSCASHDPLGHFGLAAAVHIHSLIVTALSHPFRAEAYARKGRIAGCPARDPIAAKRGPWSLLSGSVSLVGNPPRHAMLWP